MTTICIACGMPMERAQDHALGDTTRPYCHHCARPDGTMQSYGEKLANYAGWLVSTQGLDPAVARAQAVTILGQLPAWRGQSAPGEGGAVMADPGTATRSGGAIDIWHVAYPVADLDRSIAFYCDGLGFEVVGRDGHSAFVRLGEGGFTIELLIESHDAMTHPRRAPDHVAFESADLDAYRETLIAAGLSVPPIQLIGEGMKRFALDDPDGVRLDFFQGRERLERFISGAG